MGQKLPPQEMKLYKQVDEALHYLWDPIGVAGIPQARDEYHGYLPQVFKLVLEEHKVIDIAEYLIKIERESMGMTPDTKKAKEVAEKLLNIREAIIEQGF